MIRPSSPDFEQLEILGRFSPFSESGNRRKVIRRSPRYGPSLERSTPRKRLRRPVQYAKSVTSAPPTRRRSAYTNCSEYLSDRSIDVLGVEVSDQRRSCFACSVLTASRLGHAPLFRSSAYANA